MFEAQYLFSGDQVLSPWLERAGNYTRFSVDLVRNSDARIEVRMYHKNRNEIGPGTPVGPTVLLSTVGRGGRTASNLKELVRYHCKCTSIGGSPEDYDYVLFRMLDPTWWDNVKL